MCQYYCAATLSPSCPTENRGPARVATEHDFVCVRARDGQRCTRLAGHLGNCHAEKLSWDHRVYDRDPQRCAHTTGGSTGGGHRCEHPRGHIGMCRAGKMVWFP